jgi:hypothetical protein
MFQIVMDPTRKKNTLDLILVNNERMIKNYDQQVNETLSDHNTLVVEMNCVPDKTVKEKPLKEYYMTDIHKYDTRLKNNESRWDDFTRLMNLDNWEDEGYASDSSLYKGQIGANIPAAANYQTHNLHLPNCPGS